MSNYETIEILKLLVYATEKITKGKLRGQEIDLCAHGSCACLEYLLCCFRMD